VAPLVDLYVFIVTFNGSVPDSTYSDDEEETTIENSFPTAKYTRSTISQEKKEFVIKKKVFDELEYYNTRL